MHCIAMRWREEDPELENCESPLSRDRGMIELLRLSWLVIVRTVPASVLTYYASVAGFGS